MQVLHIDDSPMNRDFVMEELKTLGLEYRFDRAFSVHEGLRMIHEHNPPVVLLDIGAPRRDDLNALRLLRSNPLNEAITIIMLLYCKTLTMDQIGQIQTILYLERVILKMNCVKRSMSGQR